MPGVTCASDFLASTLNMEDRTSASLIHDCSSHFIAFLYLLSIFIQLATIVVEMLNVPTLYIVCLDIKSMHNVVTP